MKLLIYTRTYRKKEDYRILAAPNNDYIQDNILSEFVDFSRSVIDIDNPLNGEINVIRWSAFKSNNYMLLGVGCNNSELGDFSIDEADRPVRGFFGVIAKIPEEKNFLPYDIDFFKYVYKSLIEPHWNEKNFILGDIDCPLEINNFSLLSFSNKVSLNTIKNKTRIFNCDNKLEEYLGSCLNYNVCNIVTGLNVEGHAIAAGFMNALSFDAIGEKIVDNSKKEEQLTIHNKIKVTEEKTIQNNNILSGSSKHLMKNKFAQAIETLNPFSSSKSQRHSKNQDDNLNIDDSKSKISRVTVNYEPILTKEDADDENIELLRQAYKENKLNKNAQEGAINANLTIDSENDMLSLKNNVSDIDDLKEIIPGKQVSEKYKVLLSELKSSILSIDNYNISSEKYIEIEGLVKELIAKIKS